MEKRKALMERPIEKVKDSDITNLKQEMDSVIKLAK